MTSEPDNKPRGRPPTIDLTATEIESEKPVQDTAAAGAAGASGQSPDGPPPAGGETARSKSGGLGPLAIGVFLGAIVVAAAAFGVWSAGLVPSRQTAPAAQASATSANAAIKSEIAAISARLGKIEAEVRSRPAENPSASRLAAVEAQTKTLGDTLAALNQRLDGVAATAKKALDSAAAASSSAKGTAQGGVQTSEIDALSKRVAALEGTVKTLSASQGAAGRKDVDALARRIATLETNVKALSAAQERLLQHERSLQNANDRVARAALAAEALQANVERGAPYAAELATAKSFGADPHAAAALAPFAADGVPTADALAHELAALMPALTKASNAAAINNNKSLLSSLESHAKSLVRITPVNAPPGNEPSAVLARLNEDAGRADLAAALADIVHLPPAARKLAEPWIAKVNARNAAVAASRRLVADAMSRLAGANTAKTQ